MPVTKIIYTPDFNINTVTNSVIDGGLVKKEEYDADELFTIKNPAIPDRMDILDNVELFDDRVVINGEPCKVLQMLTKILTK